MVVVPAIAPETPSIEPVAAPGPTSAEPIIGPERLAKGTVTPSEATPTVFDPKKVGG